MLSPDRPQLVFGEVPKKEAQLRRRQEKKVQEKKGLEITPEPTPYDHLKQLPMIELAIIKEFRERNKEYQKRKQNKQEFVKEFWGPEVKFKLYMSPSIVCDCIRQAGQDAVVELTGRQEVEPTLEGMMSMNQGSWIHSGFMRSIQNWLPGSQETNIKEEEPAISGRIDFIMDDPISGINRVTELKTVGGFPFGKLNREDLPVRLQKTKGIISEEPGHRNQVLLYLWSLAKKGRKVESGSVIYLDRNSSGFKEAIIPWDEGTQEEAEEFIAKLKEAEIKIEQVLSYIRNTDPDKLDWEKIEDMLPEATVDDVSKCKNRCAHRLVCRPGLKYAIEGIKHPKRELSDFAWKKIKEREAAKMVELKETTIWQSDLGFSVKTKK